MRPTRSLLLVVCVLVASAVPAAAGVVAPFGSGDSSTHDLNSTSTADGTTLTVLSYNDVQTAAAENGTLPRLATLVERRRAAHDNPTVVVGGGDQVSPHSLSPLTQWRTPVDALNVVDPAADVVGNHDLDYGFGAVKNYSEASEFPWVMSNIDRADSGEPIPGTKDHVVVERQGVKIGIIGLADEKIKSKTAVDFDDAGYELKDPTTVAREKATYLKQRENVDVVIALSHLGVPVAKDLAKNTENVDVFVVGDDEIEYPPQETSGAVIMEAEARAEHLAELNLTVERGEVTAWNGRLLNVTQEIPKNETVSNVITEARGEELGKVAGVTDVPLDARFSSNYHDETALGNMIADSFREKTGADVAITNAGGIRSNSVYGPGNLTVGDVYNVLPFRNTLVTVELSGAELKRLLASQVVTLESEEGRQYGAEAKLQVGGVTYEWVGHENETKIRDVWVNGEPLDPDATYNVTVNSYMAGWDGSVLENATRVSESNTLYGTALLDYVRAHSPVAPADANRIRRVDQELGAGTARLDGEGTTQVTLSAPENADKVYPETVYALSSDGTRVNATHASIYKDELTLVFDDSSLGQYYESVEVYGEFNSTAYNRTYFEHSVFNAEVTLEQVKSKPTTTTTATPTTTAATTTATTTAAATTTTTDGEGGTGDTNSGGQPGFGLSLALVAVVGAGLLALRRD